jgi:hypothetical protein
VLNYEASTVVANLAVVAAGVSAQVCVTSSAAADVIVDVAAWAPPDVVAPIGAPVRLVDTRIT